MARLIRPLFSDHASGSLARSITFVDPPLVSAGDVIEFSRFPSCRLKTHAVNPRTGAQLSQRLSFSLAKNLWNSLPLDAKTSWNILASSPLNGYNAFLRYILTGVLPEGFIYYMTRSLPSPSMSRYHFARFLPAISIDAFHPTDTICNVFDIPEILIFPTVHYLSPKFSIYIPYLFPRLRTGIYSTLNPTLTPALFIALLLVPWIYAASPPAPQSQVITVPWKQVSQPTLLTEVIEL